MNMGEIYLVEFPITDTHEQSGNRPSVIVIDFPELPIVHIAPLTTSEKTKIYNHTVIIEPDEENHLDKISIILLFQLRAIDRRRLKKRIGNLKLKDLERLKQALREMYNL